VALWALNSSIEGIIFYGCKSPYAMECGLESWAPKILTPLHGFCHPHPPSGGSRPGVGTRHYNSKGATPLQPFLFFSALLTLQFYVIAATATKALPRVLFGCRDTIPSYNLVWPALAFLSRVPSHFPAEISMLRLGAESLPAARHDALASAQPHARLTQLGDSVHGLSTDNTRTTTPLTLQRYAPAKS